MGAIKGITSLDSFETFGSLLKFLRQRKSLSQAELGAAVGYSSAQINRLERDVRPPQVSVVKSRFIAELDLESELETAERLIELAEAAESTSKTASKHLINFPAQTNPLIGRSAQLTELKPLALRQRLLTLTGAGGVGKGAAVFAFR